MYLVFDIGGTNLRAGYSEDGQTFVNTKSVPTPQSYQEGLQAIFQLGADLSGNKISQAAIGIAGTIFDNQLTAVPHILDWAGKPLAEDFLQHFGVEPIIRNDAETGALGEAKFGAGKNYSAILYFTIGTGVGGAWVKNSVAKNLEPGHQLVDGIELEKLILNSDQKAHYTAVGIHDNLQSNPAQAVILNGGHIIHNRISLEEVKTELHSLGDTEVEVLTAALRDEAGLYGALSLLT